MSDTIDEASRKFLEGSLDQLKELFPEFDPVLHKAELGETTQDEAFFEMAEIMAKHPERSECFLEKSLTTYNERFHDIAPIDLGGDISPEELVIKPPVGLPRLHPMYEAAILERLQFDGDIPELRSGPMPDGVDPAVPVDTEARSPVAMGFLLQLAAREVGREVDERREAAYDQLNAVIQPMLTQGHTPGTSLAKRIDQELALTHLDKEVDPESYRRGEVPQLYKLEGETPNGSTLACLDQKDKQDFAWKALSTTQGRHSAVPIIEQDVCRELLRAGFSVAIGEKRPDEDLIAEHLWTFELSGPNAMQSNFSFLEVAGKVVTASLKQQLGEKLTDRTTRVFLNVQQVAQLQDRRVGWVGRIYHYNEV